MKKSLLSCILPLRTTVFGRRSNLEWPADSLRAAVRQVVERKLALNSFISPSTLGQPRAGPLGQSDADMAGRLVAEERSLCKDERGRPGQQVGQGPPLPWKEEVGWDDPDLGGQGHR